MSNNDLYTSYFATLTTDRKSPPKQQKPAPKEAPKKLSKSFTRQLSKTLGTTNKKNKKKINPRKSYKAVSQNKRKSFKKMSKRAAPADLKETPTTKKTKATLLPAKEIDKEGQSFWEISGKRRLQLSEFKGTTMVGVREFYEKNGEALPGKKGISMTLDQFNTIVELLPQIERELDGKGLVLKRPRYGDDGRDDMEEEDEDDAEDGKDGSGDEKDGAQGT